MPRFACLAIFSAAVFAPAAPAQEKPAAATVNGVAIPQAALDRALQGFKDSERDKARTEILDFLIDNALIDQYLQQQKVGVEQKEVDQRLAEIKQEIVKNGSTYAKALEELKMSEAEFVGHVANDLRWEKYALAQSTNENLKKMFQAHPDMFDGSMVRARHILLYSTDPKVQEAAPEQLREYKKVIETKAAAAVAKLPATVDKVTREQERQKQIEIAFMEIAKDRSVCPSKKDGGDVNWFPRAGHMVEAFAKAAFALKPFEMSEPVQTQFGWHLILCTGRKPGQAVKFEDVKDEVREVYCNRLREAIAAHMKQNAKIVIKPGK